MTNIPLAFSCGFLMIFKCQLHNLLTCGQKDSGYEGSSVIGLSKSEDPASGEETTPVRLSSRPTGVQTPNSRGGMKTVNFRIATVAGQG